MLRPSYSSAKFGLFYSSKLFQNHYWYNARGISFAKSKDRDAMSSSEDQALAESTAKLGELSLKPGAIASFVASPESFTIISTIGPSSKTGIKKLYILDSSFNPPTLAHKHIAKSAYLYDDPTIEMREKRLLLLLAIQNADKPAQPASFEQRLTMMGIFASEIFSGLGDLPDTGIDIGLTKLPYFHSKAVAIEESGLYDSSEPVRQVYLTGYDTLVRILNPEYYPPLKNLTPLEPFFSKHQLLVQYRPDDKWGSMQEQDEFLKPLRRGDLEKIGGKKGWGDRIELGGGDFEGARVVSSTKVRQAVKKGDKVALSGLVTDKVADYILKEKLYLEK